MRARLPALLGMVSLWGAPALAEEQEYFSDRVHADLPIYTFNYEELWPRAMEPSDDVIAGCTSRVSFGDWKFEPSSKEAAEPYWMRSRNYGVFHCGALIAEADERQELGEADETLGFFARIGEQDADDPEQEFWVLQRGTVPGSDYILLARDFNEDQVTRFTVLQRRCPIGATRSAFGMDIFLVGYCSINSHDDMLRFAEEMAKLPPLGELLLQKDPEANEAVGFD